MEIRCTECKTYLGDIEKAKLKKGMVYLCGKCESARKLMKTAKIAASNPLDDFLGGIFRR